MWKDTQQQEKYRILLIGESCEDVYVYGSIDRISPEAPVPVFKKVKKEKKTGMAGNVLNNLISFGKCNFEFFSFFNDKNLIKKIRFVDQKSRYQVMRYDIEKDIEPLKVDQINKQNYDAIIMSDYDKGFLSIDLIKKVVNNFKDTKIFVDTKKRDLSPFKNCVIKLNKLEKELAFNIDDSNEVIVTLGKDGCQYKDKIYPTKKVVVHDVCGAGDVFLSSLVINWLETKSMTKAIKTANMCASLSVTKPGCYIVQRSEYENCVHASY
jgi:bifunctional ADP-heptose synthase (sugar kinase/adenylyltransferase)